jgi:hypothetical protein
MTYSLSWVLDCLDLPLSVDWPLVEEEEESCYCWPNRSVSGRSWYRAPSGTPDQMFASLTFTLLSLLGVIPAGMTGLSVVFTDVCLFWCSDASSLYILWRPVWSSGRVLWGRGGVFLQLTKPVSQRLVLVPSPVWDSWPDVCFLWLLRCGVYWASSLSRQRVFFFSFFFGSIFCF